MRVARVNGSEVGLQLLPLSNQQHIDFCTVYVCRADTWALCGMLPGDKPMESLLDILKLGVPWISSPGGVLAAVGEGYFSARSPCWWPGLSRLFRAVRNAQRRHSANRRWLNNDDNAMNRKLSLICAVAVGIGGWSPFASYAEPAPQARTTTVPVAGMVADSQPTATLADPAAWWCGAG